MVENLFVGRSFLDDNTEDNLKVKRWYGFVLAGGLGDKVHACFNPEESLVIMLGNLLEPLFHTVSI